jgi:hypothetical protein
VAAVTAGVARAGCAGPQASGTGSGNKLGKMAGVADPEHNAQCDEPCLRESGRGSAGAELGSAFALRLAEQKSSSPGVVAEAYRASGASNCAVNATSTTAALKRDLITGAIVPRVPLNAPRTMRPTVPELASS